MQVKSLMLRFRSNKYTIKLRLFRIFVLQEYVTMLRQIITPIEPSFTLELPKEMLGKTVEIIAFELKEADQPFATEIEKTLRVKEIEAITRNSLVDLSKFEFNRNEANNYGD